MNQNALAKAVCEREGGFQNLTIAQVKEVTKHLLDILAESDPVDVLVMLKKRSK